MNLSRSFLVSALIACCPLAAGAAETLPASELEQLASDVLKWQQLANGVYEGSTGQGETVRVYANDGVRLYLADLRSELRRVEAKARHGNADERQQAERRAVAIRTDLQGLGLAFEEQERLDPTKASQTWDWQSWSGWNTVCGFVPYGDSTFTASDFGFVDYPWAEATFLPLGWGPQFGPMPPLPPYVYRSVSTTVDGNSDFDSDAGNSNVLQALSGTVVFAGSHCDMRTVHTLLAYCSIYLPPVSVVLSREQTCGGVINGTPPVVTP